MKTSLWYTLSILLLMFRSQPCATQENSDENRAVKRDSIISEYSIDEILEYKELYEREISKIEKEKKNLREKGIRDALNFMKNNPDSKVLDKVYIRLAELYYQQANEQYLETMQEYERKIEEQERLGVIDSALVEPQKNYDNSLNLYQKLIQDYPQSVLIDDAIYNTGFLLEELNRHEEAIQTYNHLVDDFPESRYVPESLMRVAEYYFNPPLNDIEKAVEIFKQILEYKDSPKYDEALYRLGWSYYRLNKYPEAVAYFTLLADDVESSTDMDPGQKYSNPALRDESIEYIGISFLDYGGSERAVEYIKSIGDREYGPKILMKIGDVYKDEKEEYEKAIDAYNVLLKTYPDNAIAPITQMKIVDCYRHLKDDMMAYLGRDKLYNQYKPGSPWWQKNPDEKLQEKTYVLSERSLRDNISLLYQKAEVANDQDLYLQAVNDNRKYLKSFPTDTSAAQIHWNMALTLDTKLHDYDSAFEEYMKICDLYWDSKYQKDAAKNAIALAKDMVASDTTPKEIVSNVDTLSDDKTKTSVLLAVNYKRFELSESEQKLARAYDNYIKIFPHESETAMILANAGAVFYNNNQFSEALKYFNTIIKHFPNSKDLNYAQYMVMEGYFGKRDFKSAEIVAKRLKISAESNPEIFEKAKKRLAESIFLSAEVYADSANYLAAGNEYIRMVAEVPDAEFADLSLFNAALQYDKAKEYSRAAETYNYLIDSKPNSKYLLDAMNNLAYDYGELNEYKNAGLTYEKLATTAKDSAIAYDALYNSSIFFVKGEEWEDAIRINRKFVQRYPNSADADNLFFDIATYYLKMDDLDNANKIYGDYVLKYPNSPRVVETYYQRGEYYRNKGEYEQAITEYDRAVAKNEEFKRKNIDTNDFYAAEALFYKTKLKYDQYQQIDFYLPQARMEQDKMKKKDLLKEVIDGFTNVVSYGTLRLYEATYFIGDSYEEFAESWVRQEIPPMEENKRIVYQKQINQTSAELYGRAEKSYKQAVDVLTRLANQYRNELLVSDTLRVEGAPSQKIVTEDSTLRVAKKWTDRCQDKISEVIYDIAELNFASVKLFLDAPIPEGLDDLAEMEYRKQVLSKAVAPLIQQITEDHTRNVKEAWDMGLENQWVKLSRNKIIQANNILSNEYQKLAYRALQLYHRSSQEYEKITAAGGISDTGVDAIEISEKMANLLDFGKIFATVALDLKRNTLIKAAAEKISDPSVAETKENLLKDICSYTQHSDSLITIANKNRKKYENLFKETDKPEYEEALFTYEDNLFSLKESMTDLLERAYEVSEEMNIKNKWATKVLLSLVRFNPEQYCNILNLSIASHDIYSNATWLVVSDYRNGWTNINFDDSNWTYAFITESNEYDVSNRSAKIWHVKMDTLAVNRVELTPADSNQWIADNDTSLSDTLEPVAQDQSLMASKPDIKKVLSDRVFFRKTFVVEGLPVSADISLKADDSYNIFLNGEYMANFEADSTEWQNERNHQLSDFLLMGTNVLAIEAKDKDHTGGGVEATLHIKSIPDWELIRQKFEIESSDEKVRQNLIMDKYIILF